MNVPSASAPTAPPTGQKAPKAAEAIRAAELGPALKRNRILQRVLAARKRLPRT